MNFDHDANEFGFTCVAYRAPRPAYRAPGMKASTKVTIFCIACAAIGAVAMLAHFLKG